MMRLSDNTDLQKTLLNWPNRSVSNTQENSSRKNSVRTSALRHWCNATGSCFPGFILYRAAREAFSLIQYQDIRGNATNIRFQEEENVPSDSTVVGSTWAKANKDGSRDRRFANNYQIPMVQYGHLTLKSTSGLWEEFHFSNLDRMVKCLTALNAFTSSFEPVGG